MTLIHERYPPTYRQEIVQQVFRVTQEGRSMCLVGLAGVGKSNLLTFLEQPQVQVLYSELIDKRTRIVRVPCEKDTDSPESVYRSLLSALARSLDLPHPESRRTGEFDALRSALDLHCKRQNQRIVFILDEFEQLIRAQSSTLFEALRVLRDDHRTTGNLAYVLVMHRMPQVIVGRQPFAKSRLFEIVRNDIYALGPYTKEDAYAMIDALCTRRRVTLSDLEKDRLYKLSGGHSGLLKSIFMAMHPHFSNFSVLKILRLAETDPEVAAACKHIWEHLHTEEQFALSRLVRGASLDLSMVEFLQRRGLVRPGSRGELFSEVFQKFVKGIEMG